MCSFAAGYFVFIGRSSFWRIDRRLFFFLLIAGFFVGSLVVYAHLKSHMRNSESVQHSPRPKDQDIPKKSEENRFLDLFYTYPYIYRGSKNKQTEIKREHEAETHYALL